MMKRKLLALLLACIFLTSAVQNVMATENAQIPLSQLEDCIAFLEMQGMTVPEELKDRKGIEIFARKVIESVENDPNVVFVYNDYALQQFANDIKTVVNAYYEENYGSTSEQNGARTAYLLVDNVTVGPWREEYLEYNCYAYVLGYTSSPTNELFAPYPGYFSDDLAYKGTDALQDWAELTVKDLYAKGNACVHMTTSYSGIMELVDTHTVICLRQGNPVDFHYMRYNAIDGAWYHKPGATHVLKFRYERPDAKIWIGESSTAGVASLSHIGQYYDGTIYYFAFRLTHNLRELGRTGNHYHMGEHHYFEYARACEDCGETTYYWVSSACDGPPCSIPIGSTEPGESLE